MTEPSSSKSFRPGVIGYLFSADSFSSRGRRIASVLILLLWLAFVVLLCAKHEYWRDEIRAFSIALEPDSFWGLPSALTDEGHPVLWYVILRAGFLITRSPVIIGIASVGLAFASVVVFYRTSPFPAWQKLLFLFSVLPIYEYSVMARNYGVGMLLFFVFAMLYRRRNRNPIWIGVTLAALANTSAHACILAGAMTAAWLFDDVVIGRRSLNIRRGIVLACALLIAAAGILCSVRTMLPTSATVVTNAMSLSASAYMNAMWESFIHPGAHLTSFAIGLPGVVADILVWLLAAGLLIRPHLAISLLAGNVALGTFFTTVIPAHLRHQGILLIFAITLYWIAYGPAMVPQQRKLPGLLRHAYRASLYLVLTVIFVNHVVLSVWSIRSDLNVERSSSKAFGQFIDSTAEFQDAIIMGEPDVALEALPYYVRNRIYLPREERFANRTRLTLASKPTLTLGDLLRTAQRIKATERKPVLVVLGRIKPTHQRPYEYHYIYNKSFVRTPGDWSDFRSQTRKVASFDHAVTDENYSVYAVQ